MLFLAQHAAETSLLPAVVVSPRVLVALNMKDPRRTEHPPRGIPERFSSKQNVRCVFTLSMGPLSLLQHICKRDNKLAELGYGTKGLLPSVSLISCVWQFRRPATITLVAPAKAVVRIQHFTIS